jgi:hypothetical protein
MFGWIATSSWAFPALEVVHIVGIALLLGNLVLVELRVWGAGAALDAAALGRLAVSLSLAGFGLIVVSGTLMFASQPQELLANRAFAVKLTLMFLAACNAALFHARGGFAMLDGTAKTQTLLSVGLWIGAIIAGRWIAYL